MVYLLFLCLYLKISLKYPDHSWLIRLRARHGWWSALNSLSLSLFKKADDCESRLSKRKICLLQVILRAFDIITVLYIFCYGSKIFTWIEWIKKTLLRYGALENIAWKKYQLDYCKVNFAISSRELHNIKFWRLIYEAKTSKVTSRNRWSNKLYVLSLKHYIRSIRTRITD